ncbi:C4-dicarboxylate transporter DcuC [Helicobacter ibis]|uniref:C4-dicarboxylate transporter DcuC n=1 Tax=Helicobacter ibis TaxID=2962633 RepID=A0ABT4VDB8_9HELI|nr:C4-dicarboxylate transporter DcuC [Helicobacter ibis]MDA3968701.1 C4-dicarboxylate transporter DcuC [Helicobacter ibis]
MQLFMIFSTLISVIIVSYYILKKYNPIFIFLFSGIILIIFAFYITGTPIPKSPTREDVSFLNVLLDSYAFIVATFKEQLSGTGLIIMSVAGFAAYMKHINASAKLAFLANKSLGKIQNKYLILSGTFVVGMALKIVISSYTGLLLLLLACIYPVLIALKIRPITAVCVLSLIALDYGPKDANKDAKKLGEDMVVILKGMAEIFVSVVSILIATSVFAKGIESLGGIGILVNAMKSFGEEGEFAWIAVLLSITILSFLVYFASVIMGSGIAAFNVFGKLAPDIATKLGIAPITLVLPIEIASCLGRAASPISGGILALAGFAKVSPMDIIKRTTPLLLIAMIINIAVAFYLS